MQARAMTAAGNPSVVPVRSARRNPRRPTFSQLSELRQLRDCEQVAAVCYRVRKHAIEFLLVRTRGGRRWTFPKGSAERGLTHAQAAALEAFEEAGVRGRIEEASFAKYYCEKRSLRGENLWVSAHLCEVYRLVMPKEMNRDRTWCTPEGAKLRLRKNRNVAEAAEFCRILDSAVARIEDAQQRRSQSGHDRGSLVQEQHRERDSLHAVRFEAADRVRQHWSEFVPKTRLPTSPLPPVFSAEQARKLLPADILPFSAKPPADSRSRSNGRKAMTKALGPRLG
jgi:8-oxo-dGTP pyrophosphatase MutT (NUDIX family)